MSMKKVSILLAVIGAVAMIIGIVSIISALNVEDSGSIGIIGGADAPTLEFMFNKIIHSWAFFVAIIGVAALAASVVLAIVSKSKPKE